MPPPAPELLSAVLQVLASTERQETNVRGLAAGKEATPAAFTEEGGAPTVPEK